MDRFWIILGIIVFVLVGLFFFTRPNTPQMTLEEAVKIEDVDHVTWNPDADVTLIEYGDFQCPGCGGWHPILKQLEESYKDHVRFVFRHFPIRTNHPNAQSAALSAEAAGKQGKFWEMHDKLFETQPGWRQLTGNQQKLFESYAEELELDMKQFRSDYAASETALRINRDLDSGRILGVTGTPSFILNGKKIETPARMEDFAKILDREIKKAGGTPPGAAETSSED